MKILFAAPWSRVSSALRAAFVGLALALAALPAAEAKPTVLGMEMIPRHMPSPTYSDLLAALQLTNVIAGHSSFIWHWSEDHNLPLVVNLVGLMKAYGLKSKIQVGPVFLRYPSPPAGYVESFADPLTRQRYLDDVRTIAAAKPDYLVLCTEANLLQRFNPEEFAHFKTLYAEAYHAVKAISPGTSVGASYLYTVWFAEYYVDDKDVPGMLLPRDFIAFTSYPLDLINEGWFASPSDIPAAWFTAGRQAYPSERILFSEMAWPSKHLGTPQTQVELVREIPRLVSGVGPETVTWAVLHDNEFFGRHLLTPEAVAFLEGLDVDIDALFMHFNGMGLLDGFGFPKPAFEDAYHLTFPTASP